MKPFRYERIEDGKYKYRLLENVTIQTGIKGISIRHTFMRLTRTGRLTIKKGYAWDGPSGPTIDTVAFILASLFHDALYQATRLGLLPLKYRKAVDDLLREHCIEYGMSRFRARYVYWAVRLFGGAAAKGEH